MTSNRSDKKNNVFLHNAAEKIRKNIPLFILICLFDLVSAGIITVGAFGNAKQFNELNDDFIITAAFFFAGALALTIPALLGCFPQLHKKSAVDTEFSLPLGTKSKMFSDLTAAAVMNFVPFLCSCAVMLIGFLIGYAMFEGEVGVPATEYSYEVVSHLFGNLLGRLGYFAVDGVCLIALTMAMTFFIAVFSGNLFETISYMILFSLLIPSGFRIVPSVMKNYSYSGYFADESIVYNTSPATAFYSLYQMMNGTKDLMYHKGWIIPVIISAAVFAGAAVLICPKRRAEQTGSALTSRGLLAAAELASILVGISYYIDSNNLLIICIIIALIAAIEIIYNVKKPAVLKSVIKLASMAAAIALFIGLANATNKFGIITSIPSADKIESVHIETNLGADYSSWEADLAAPEEIEKIRELQQSLIDFYLDNKKEIDKSYKYEDFNPTGVASFGNADITYTLKNGGKVHRYYIVDYDSFYNYISIANMDGAKKAAAEEITKDLDYVENSVFTYRSFNMFGMGQKYDFDDVPDDYSARLADALKTDIENETYEQYTHRPMPVGEIMAFMSNIRVYPHYVNTLAVLREELDIDTPVSLADTENAAIFRIKTPDEKAADFDFGNKFFTRSILERYTWSYYADDYKQEPPLLCLEYLKEKLPSGEYEDVISALENIIANSYSTYVGEGDFTVITGISWYDNAIIPDEYAEAARELKKYEITPDEYIKWHEEWEKGKKQN